ncbi:hypothetical protein G7A72_03220 [Flavobacterium sp. Sr18]|nr:hypothetical protein [Flavobacterium sp. Sr18]QIH37870.1 hypothetical protein G7A72_03220 [Flavobacterium sp. Sr18]
MNQEDQKQNENNDDMLMILFQLNRANQIQKDFLKSLDDLFTLEAEQED